MTWCSRVPTGSQKTATVPLPRSAAADVPLRSQGMSASSNVAWLQTACVSSAERGAGVERPVTPSRTSEAILEKHSYDGHHSKASVGDFSIQAPRPHLNVVGGKQRRLPAVVTGCSFVNLATEAAGLAPGSVGEDLEPASSRHLGDRRKAVGDISKLELRGVGQVARELACELRCDVAHGGQHGDAAMLDLRGAAALEGLLVSVLGVAKGVPEAERRLNAKLRLERPEGGVRVVRPVAPG